MAAFASLILLFVVTRSTPRLDVRVFFVGYTNDATGNRLAAFTLTNQTEIQIYRWGLYHRETRQPQIIAPVFFGSSKLLAPGQSETLLVPLSGPYAPTNSGPWRAGFDCSHDGWRRKFSSLLASFPSLKRVVPRQWERVPTELAMSEWIND